MVEILGGNESCGMSGLRLAVWLWRCWAGFCSGFVFGGFGAGGAGRSGELACLLGELKQTLQGFVYGFGSGECLGDFRPEKDQVRAFLIGRVVFAADAFAEVFTAIFGTKVAGLRFLGFLHTCYCSLNVEESPNPVRTPLFAFCECPGLRFVCPMGYRVHFHGSYMSGLEIIRAWLRRAGVPCNIGTRFVLGRLGCEFRRAA